MMQSGLIDDWRPKGGQLTIIRPSEVSRAAAIRARTDATPPSFQQDAYLEMARTAKLTGQRFDRLILCAFTLQGVPDIPALVRATTTIVRRHDAFHSWFEIDAEYRVLRRVVQAEDIHLVADSWGEIDGPLVSRIVQHVTPGPSSWDCFTFAVIDHGGSFTVVVASDHINCDAISGAIISGEFAQLYFDPTGAERLAAVPVASYRAHCDRERSLAAQLETDSPQIVEWADRIRANGGRLPSFPLPLRDTDSTATTHAASDRRVLLTGALADRFEAECAAAGVRLVSGIFAAAAYAEYELSGRTRYFNLSPKSTRADAAERRSVGWYASLIPIAFDFDPADGFEVVAQKAEAAFVAGKWLSDVSLHRVVELLEEREGFEVRRGWVAPMLSFLDLRKLPGAELFEALEFSFYGSRGTSEEVYTWVQRTADNIWMASLFPDTGVAARSMARYGDVLTRVLESIVHSGSGLPSGAVA
ncbi:condensation domain-containing protein [Nocardia huaxiensis]|uniref:Acyltransferase n=1 Tax=Nocardia huaxiensis TaxID=2755382 RepID=A0A7D6ZQ53_9NOCA|nr:condensation domain-containing protein [Nocardia huaxiensis]QLY32623.1 acyltransferase [Nocardia huaxiensis]UFS93647.1 condensation domain-containing protein [Nocardia huaxiensis]